MPCTVWLGISHTHLSIISVVASWVRFAQTRNSPATAAKPLPCSPALAASMSERQKRQAWFSFLSQNSDLIRGSPGKFYPWRLQRRHGGFHVTVPGKTVLVIQLQPFGDRPRPILQDFDYRLRGKPGHAFIAGLCRYNHPHYEARGEERTYHLHLPSGLVNPA